MALGPFVRVPVASLPSSEPVEPSPTVHRRRRSLPRTLTARARARAPRARKLFAVRRREAQPQQLTSHHDFGDGRHALEFEPNSVDMMLYHDRGVTIAEWVTVDGRLIMMIAVGEC